VTDSSAAPSPAHPTFAPPSFGEAFRFWLKLGFINFGGPAGQIAIMSHELMDRRRWISERDFMAGLSFANLLPGPEAQQLATYIGWRLHGLKGALAAGVLFVVPGAIVLWLLAWAAAAWGSLPAVAAVFWGMSAVVIAIIVGAGWRLGQRVLKRPAALVVAAATLIAFHLADLTQGYVANVPFPWIVGGALLMGAAIGLSGRSWFQGSSGHSLESPGDLKQAPFDIRREALRVASLCITFCTLWIVPVAAVVVLVGPSPFKDVATLFTKAAFVTFGGAYAVLPYIADAAVNGYHWLAPADMVKGLALAETTPGPLILVTQFVGFFAGWNQPGALAPALAGLISAALTTWVTFLPCFLFILAGAPYIASLARFTWTSEALAALSAAVVGAILSLAITLGLAVLWPPAQGHGLDWWALALAAIALIALVRFKVNILWLVLAGGAVGLLRLAL
jgi:chromate transporter